MHLGKNESNMIRIGLSSNTSHDEIIKLKYTFNLIGVVISTHSRIVYFSICTFGLFFFYCLYGAIQEYLFKKIPGFRYGMFLTFIQFLIYTLVLLAHLNPREQIARMKANPEFRYTLLLLSLISVITIGFSNISVQYLNYPTQVMFKSCKLIPVMVVGVFYLKKSYHFLDYVSAISLTLGMVLFSVGDSIVQTTWSTIGLILILSALGADAFMGNIQELCLHKFQFLTPIEIVFWTKAYGSVFLIIMCIIKFELIEAFVFCWNNPIIYVYFILFSLTGVIGEVFVMGMIKHFGALVAVITTTSRKMITILISFLVYPKPFTRVYLFGMVLVSAGVILHSYAKKLQKHKVIYSKLSNIV